LFNYTRAGQRREYRIQNWVPTNVYPFSTFDLELIIGFQAAACAIPDDHVKIPWNGLLIGIKTNAGTIASTANEWTSASATSGALYPWHWDLPRSYSNTIGSIVLQFMVTGKTSEHYHPAPNPQLAQTIENQCASSQGGSIAETFVPLDKDSHTILRQDEKLPTGLTAPVDMPWNCAHQLVRDKPGFSVQLLRMNTWVPFQNRSLHLHRTVV